MKKYSYRVSKCVVGNTEQDVSHFITSFSIFSETISPYKKFIIKFGIKQEFLKYFTDINYGAVIDFEYEVYVREGSNDNTIKKFEYKLLVLSNLLPIPFGSASKEEEKVMKSYNYLEIISIPYKAYNKAANEINQIYNNTTNKKILKDIFESSDVKYYINPDNNEEELNNIDIDQFFIPNLSLFDSFKHLQQYSPLFKKHFNIFVDDSNYVNDIIDKSPKDDYLCYINDHNNLFKQNVVDIIIYLTNENNDYSEIYEKIIEDEHRKYYCRLFSQPMRNRLPGFMYHKRFNQKYIHYGLNHINQIFESDIENLIKTKGIFDLDNNSSFNFDLDRINQKRTRILANDFLIDQNKIEENFKNRFAEEINPLNDIIIRNDYYFHPGIIPGSVVELSMDGRKSLPSLEMAYSGKFVLRQIEMKFKVPGLSSDQSVCHTYLTLARTNTTTHYIGYNTPNSFYT